MERVCIYIDGSNLYHRLKEEFGQARLDFAKFIAWLVGNRVLVRTYYYTAAVTYDAEQASKQQRFLASLKRIPYLEIKLGRLEPRGNTHIEKGLDVTVSVDMLSMASKNLYDVAILVSCDGDYVKAVDAVKDTGKHVEVACFQKAYHLREHADRIIHLDETSLAGLWLPPRQLPTDPLTKS
jgi:uncharacterized LabA/DUF88 family protein